MNKVTVEFRNALRQENILLSVRPKSLIVSPLSISDAPKDTLVAHAYSIPFDSVYRVLYQRERILRDAVPGAIWGAPIGFFTGAIIAFAIPLGPYILSASIVPYIIVAITTGSAIGGWLAYASGGEDKIFDPMQFRDYIALSKLALYPIKEPPELQRIK